MLIKKTAVLAVMTIMAFSIGGHGQTDDWTRQVRSFRAISAFTPDIQRFFMYECVEPEGYLLNCFQNMILLTGASAPFAYSNYTPLQVAYPRGARPFLEKIVDTVVGDAQTDKVKVGKLLAWMPGYRPQPEYAGPLPPRISPLPPPLRNAELYYRNPEEWVIKDATGDCAAHARVFVVLCQIAGIPARIVQLQNHHTVAEAYVEGRWCYCDAIRGAMLFLEDGVTPANAWQICQGRKVSWNRLAVPLTTAEQSRINASSFSHDWQTYVAPFCETAVGNYGYFAGERREAVPFFGVGPSPCPDGINVTQRLSQAGATRLAGPWVVNKGDVFEQAPTYTPLRGAGFAGQGALAIEVASRSGGRITTGLYFGGHGPNDCWGLILYEGYGVKLFRCQANRYRDVAVADYPTQARAAYRLAVVTDGRKVHGFVNGEHVLEATGAVAAGEVGLFSAVEARAVFKDLIVAP